MVESKFNFFNSFSRVIRGGTTLLESSKSTGNEQLAGQRQVTFETNQSRHKRTQNKAFDTNLNKYNSRLSG